MVIGCGIGLGESYLEMATSIRHTSCCNGSAQKVSTQMRVPGSNIFYLLDFCGRKLNDFGKC
jgi:hypothetical protein